MGHTDDMLLCTVVQGHRATNLSQWIGSDGLYKADFEFQYEPWYLATRIGYVLYDERFRGYGREKIAQLMNVNASGYQLLIHPTAFIVHRCATMLRMCRAACLMCCMCCLFDAF